MRMHKRVMMVKMLTETQVLVYQHLADISTTISESEGNKMSVTPTK